MDHIVGTYYPYVEIVNHLDIQKGDVVYVASNIIKLIKFAKKNEQDFSADKFIESLQRKVGEQGTLLFPAYNYNLISGQQFDLKNTEPITGTLAIKAFERADFKRTKHPLHSFSVWGNYTEQLVNMNNYSSFASDSPFHFLHEKKAKLLVIDLDLQHALTFVHYVEELEKVTYRRWKKFIFEYINEHGKTSLREYKLFAKRFGYVNEVNSIRDNFLTKKAMDEKVINDIPFKIIYLDKAFEIIREDIRSNKAMRIKYFSLPVFFKDVLRAVKNKF